MTCRLPAQQVGPILQKEVYTTCYKEEGRLLRADRVRIEVSKEPDWNNSRMKVS